MNTEQINLISHTLGINVEYCERSIKEKDKLLPKVFYRNFFDYGIFTEDMQELESLGLIEKYSRLNLELFHVTDEGIEAFRTWFNENITSKYKKPSRSKLNYQEFLSSDCSYDFAWWLNIEIPKIEYSKNGYLRRMYKYKTANYHTYEITGEFCRTHKEAKASYKESLKLNKLKNSIK